MISPLQTATAAAGVDNLIIYFSNFSKAEFRVDISLGSLAKQYVGIVRANISKRNSVRIIYNFFCFFIKSLP